MACTRSGAFGAIKMSLMVWFILAISVFCSCSQAMENPYTLGSYPVKEHTFNSIFNNALDHNVKVIAPDKPGTYPVIYFITGVAGLIPPVFYSIALTQIASHGFIVISPFSYIGSPTAQYNAQWLIEIDIWAQKSLGSYLEKEGFQLSSIDFASTFMVGHSSGNHVIINYLKSGCYNVKGTVLLSPVDGVDPFGFIDDYCITPGEKLSFETPTLVLSVGLDNVPGVSSVGDLFPPCAPDNLSNLRFWNALNGPAWLNNATLFGHTDILDPGIASNVAGFLHVCAHNDNGIDDVLISFTAGQIVSLFSGLQGDCESLKFLEDTTLMPTTVEVRSQGEVKCPMGYCSLI